MIKHIGKITLAGFGILGGYRNVNSNIYLDNCKVNKYKTELAERINDGYISDKYIKHLKNTIEHYEKPKLLIDHSENFLIGSIMYMNPFLFFINFEKELYRLEVDIRGLEKEKQSARYNINWFNYYYD